MRGRTKPKMTEAQRPLTYLSLGAGVQSSALFVMAALGLRGCPRPEVAVFADTQDEPKWVYRQVEALTAFGEQHGLPVVHVTAGRLSNEVREHVQGLRKRRAAIPAFTIGDDGREAMLPRQCTAEYKLVPIKRYVRQRLGYRPRQRIPVGSATALIGLSFDECGRMKESLTAWIVNRWPLIDAAITRSGCVALLEAQGVPVPNKSACIYCPYHDDAYWMMLREREPESFAEAVAFDELIRDSSRVGLVRPLYLHRSLKPLAEVEFTEAQPALDYSFTSECGGHCGV